MQYFNVLRLLIFLFNFLFEEKYKINKKPIKIGLMSKFNDKLNKLNNFK